MTKPKVAVVWAFILLSAVGVAYSYKILSGEPVALV